jgi:hypothetical protein
MVTVVLLVERLEGHGELRCFLREGPPEHLAFEIFQDEDGRGWTLRLPVGRIGVLAPLFHAARAALAGKVPLEIDAEGAAVIARESLAPAEELAAVILEQGRERRFALWRRELARTGWSWTLEALFVPLPQAPRLLEAIERALAARRQ